MPEPVKPILGPKFRLANAEDIEYRWATENVITCRCGIKYFILVFSQLNRQTLSHHTRNSHTLSPREQLLTTLDLSNWRLTFDYMSSEIIIESNVFVERGSTETNRGSSEARIVKPRKK